VKTYVFQVELKPDGEGWQALYPAWEQIGASTWGYTKEEALENIQEVLSMIVEEFVEDQQPIPTSEDERVAEGAAVTVTI
jgi:predicted RNase H-like HicB family nuclease